MDLTLVGCKCKKALYGIICRAHNLPRDTKSVKLRDLSLVLRLQLVMISSITYVIEAKTLGAEPLREVIGTNRLDGITNCLKLPALKHVLR